MKTVLLLLVIGCHGEPELEARFRREYPAAAQRLEKALKSFALEGEFRFEFFSGEVARDRQFQMAATAGQRVLAYQRDYQSGKVGEFNLPRVECVTPEATFQLRRASATGPYLIQNYEARRPRDDTFLEGTFRDSVLNMTGFRGHSLQQRLQSPGFRIESVDQASEPENASVRVVFRWASPEGDETGTIDLDPARSWAIRRTDVVLTPKPPESTAPSDPPQPPPSPLRVQTEVQYTELPGGIPFPKHTVAEIQVVGQPSRQRQILDVAQATVGPVAAERFRLSGYGLPDLPLTPRPRARILTWSSPWLWGSLVTALISFGLARSLRHRATPEVS